MNKRFAASCMVMRKDDWKMSVEALHSVEIQVAVSEDEAYGIIMKRLLDKFPQTDGYINHSILLLQINEL